MVLVDPVHSRSWTTLLVRPLLADCAQTQVWVTHAHSAHCVLSEEALFRSLQRTEPLQFNAVQCNPMQSNAIQCNPMQCRASSEGIRLHLHSTQFMHTQFAFQASSAKSAHSPAVNPNTPLLAISCIRVLDAFTWTCKSLQKFAKVFLSIPCLSIEVL